MEKREKFNSRLGFILVAAGCAVGLGNVWKFPYICGQYGGAAFIVVYLLFLVLLGLPIIICEFTVGRGSQKSVVGAFKTLEPEGQKWHHYKWFGVAGNYLLVMFYTVVSGWILYYTYKMITGAFDGQNTEKVKNQFSEMLQRPDIIIFWTVMAIVISIAVCALGVKNGVEKITKVMMVLLIVLMTILAVRSLTLDGAEEGLKFYLIPDFNKIAEVGIGEALFAAMTHAFFTISVGMGAMEIFGSYMKKNRSITGEAVNVVVLDTFVALIAGLIIIPSCFAYNIEPGAGPSLLFVTLPNVFNNMPFGDVWGACFFIFMGFAALSTLIGVFENILAMTMELWNIDRKKSVIINLFVLIILSIPAAIGFNILQDFVPLGPGSTIMDLEDFIVSYNLLPLGSLVFVLFCVKKNGWGFDNFIEEVNLGKGMKFPTMVKNYMKFVLPTVIIIIYLKGYYDTFENFQLSVRIITMLIAILLLLGIFAITKKRKIQNR